MSSLVQVDMGPILHHMLILLGFVVDLGIEVCRLQLIVHFDIVCHLLYLVAALASLRPVDICIADKAVRVV